MLISFLMILTQKNPPLYIAPGQSRGLEWKFENNLEITILGMKELSLNEPCIKGKPNQLGCEVHEKYQQQHNVALVNCLLSQSMGRLAMQTLSINANSWDFSLNYHPNSNGEVSPLILEMVANKNGNIFYKSAK